MLLMKMKIRSVFLSVAIFAESPDFWTRSFFRKSKSLDFLDKSPDFWTNGPFKKPKRSPLGFP